MKLLSNALLLLYDYQLGGHLPIQTVRASDSGLLHISVVTSSELAHPTKSLLNNHMYFLNTEVFRKYMQRKKSFELSVRFPSNQIRFPGMGHNIGNDSEMRLYTISV